MSCNYYTGEFTLEVTKDQADAIEALFEACELGDAIPSPFDREDTENGTALISIGFESHEDGYWLESAIEDFFKKAYGVCFLYPDGYIIEECDEGRYRLEIDPKTGVLDSESGDWVLKYPNWANRDAQRWIEDHVLP